GKIVRIEAENFKSYKGRQIIGPFDDFTCVIGPNGSGKSNLMDAISFVMGLRATYLRSSHLKQLIFNGDGLATQQNRTAYVKLVFKTSPEDEEEEGAEVEFTRTISSQGQTEYKINKKVVQAADYEKKLKSFGILTKARNFLVFQGDVENVASKSPQELTKLFEQISGSEEYKKEYDRLKEEYEQSNNKLITNFQKKKGISTEKTQFKNQKKDADRFDDATAEHTELQANFVLWKLYHIEKDIRKYKSELTRLNKEKSHLSSKQDTTNEEINEKKKEMAKLKKQNLLATSKVKGQKDDVTKKRESLASLKVEINHLENSLKNRSKSMDKKKNQLDKHTKDVEKLEDEIKQLEQERDEMEAKLKEESSEEIKISGADLEEYNKRKVQASEETVSLRQELSTLTGEKNTLFESQKTVLQKVEQFEERKKQLDDQKKTNQKRLEKLEESLQALETELDEKNRKKDELTKSTTEKARKKQKSEDELHQIRDKLKEARVEKRDSERELRFKEALEGMKRLFPGVLGKVGDLFTITREKYNVAVNVALGKHLNSIVCETEKTALECIKYLKEQRLGSCTFIPIDSVKAKKVNEKLRKIPNSSAKLVTDVITYEDKVDKIFKYALGNTIVCDTYDEATSICFDDDAGLGFKVKGVTVDGTVISKSGMVTGGLADVRTRTSRFKESDIEKLKNDRDKLVSDVQNLTREEASDSATLSRLEIEIKQLEGKLVVRTDVDFTKKKIADVDSELRDIEKEIKAEEPTINTLSTKISSLDSRIEKIEGEIAEIEEGIFADLSKKLGVKNIRDYENKKKKAEEHADKERSRFETMISRLTNQLELIKKRDITTSLDRLEKDVEKEEKTLSEKKDKCKKLETELISIEKDFKKALEEMKSSQSSVDDKTTEMNELKKILQSVYDELIKLAKQITAKENQIEQLRNRRQEMFMKCKLEEIELPSIKGKLKETSSLSQEFVTLDFSSIEKEKRNLKDIKEYEAIEKDFENKLLELQEEIERLAPTTAIVGKYDAISKKYKDTLEEYKQTRQDTTKIKKDFEEVKKKRKEAFMKAYDRISQSIDSIYKDLTKSDKTPGGTAYLLLEDTDEPYLHGIKFNAMPPLKRYRDMAQLSGGEKTVAALALLFSVHKYNPSPFYILDEVDAALDNVNVNKVANYIKRSVNGLTDLKCQFIIISLKENFYTDAKSLVGIMRDISTKSSKTLTIDLSQYDE
ncbi:structural maintenance of chromosome 1, partial [Naegleria gruberi]